MSLVVKTYPPIPISSRKFLFSVVVKNPYYLMRLIGNIIVVNRCSFKFVIQVSIIYSVVLRNPISVPEMI